MLTGFVASLLIGLSFRGQVVFHGNNGPGRGKSIVFLAGDEEYRSEEGLPQLARILSQRQGFKCTVLFSVNKAGEIDPTIQNDEPGLEALDSADLCVMLLRYRHWPDSQMSHFVSYYLSGRPIIALRTSTHAFDYSADDVSRYQGFGLQSREWPGGFGKHVLGETWVDHWGAHGKQATRAVPAPLAAREPILMGVKSVFVPTDVYEAFPPPDAKVLLLGQVVQGMNASDPPSNDQRKNALGREQAVNDPMMPVAWTREFRNEAGKTTKVLTCTMGAAVDLLSEGLRRFLVNGAFWCLDMKIDGRSNVDLVGEYRPSMFGFGGYKRGMKPSDYSQ